jgi:S1-C subfamily serine protease
MWTRGSLEWLAASLLLAVSVAGAGCVPAPAVKVHRTPEAARLGLEPTSPCYCPVMRTVVPKDELIVLARLSLRDPNGLSAVGREAVEVELIDAACKQGADGVIIEREHYRVPYVGTDVLAVAVTTKSKKNVANMPPTTAGARETFGTCFAIDKAGHLVTAEHVVRGATSIYVQFEAGARVPARVLMSRQQSDLAVLEIATPTPNYLELSSAANASAGDRIFTFGFPVVELLGREPKFTDGSVSSLSGIKGDPRVIQMTVPVQPGNSGGPIVTEDGLVIGIVTSSAAAVPFFRSTGAMPQGINWAVKADDALAMLNRSRRAGPPLDRAAAIKRARRAVCAVTAVASGPE